MDPGMPRGGLAKLLRAYDAERAHFHRHDEYVRDVHVNPPWWSPEPKPKPEPKEATFKDDESGLKRAYGDETGPGVYYDDATHTEYVKGTSTARDVWDDVTKIPTGLTRHAERYQQADTAYLDLLRHGRPVDRIVGHSLGGSVALQMARDHGIKKVRTFGAPVLDLFGASNPDRVRHPWDPVSIFDRSATRGAPNLNPHGYNNFDGLE